MEQAQLEGCEMDRKVIWVSYEYQQCDSEQEERSKIGERLVSQKEISFMFERIGEVWWKETLLLWWENGTGNPTEGQFLLPQSKIKVKNKIVMLDFAHSS